MFRRYPGKDAIVADSSGKFLVRQRVDFIAGQAFVDGRCNAQFFGDGYSGVFVVASNHDRRDASHFGSLDRVADLQPRRVDHSHQADNRQILLHCRRVDGLGSVPERDPEDSQRSVGHFFSDLQIGFFHDGSQRHQLAIDQRMADYFQQLIERTFGMDPICVALTGQGRHQFAFRIKRFLVDTRLFADKSCFGQPVFATPGHQSDFGGIAGSLSVFVRGIRAENKGFDQLDFVADCRQRFCCRRDIA